MIPYFEFRTIVVGPLTLQVWGFFAAVGVILASWFAVKQAKNRGLDPKTFENLVLSIIVWAFVGARFFHVIAYEPGYYWAHPLEILEIWKGGLSSYGGFIGATIAFFIGIRRSKLAWLPTADALVIALPLGLGCGRIGCFLIHDHPGTLASSMQWLAVNYSDGPRYDLGMLLGIFDFLVFGFFLLLLKKPRRDGFYFALFMVAYGPVRFLLDFLRVVDVRYFGLTPAQFGSILVLVAGMILFKRVQFRRI